MKIKSFLILATALLMVACGGNTSNKSKGEEAQAEVAATAMDIDALLASAENLVGQEVDIEGICTHICSHGGRKIFLMGSDDTKTIRIESGKFGAFDQKCVNSIVKVKGMLKEERIDEAYLKHWEELEAANAAEEHGDGEGGCSTEKAARGETGNTVEERIAGFRARIAERKEATGKEYLSFYFVEATAYEVLE